MNKKKKIFIGVVIFTVLLIYTFLGTINLKQGYIKSGSGPEAIKVNSDRGRYKLN